MQVKYTRLGVVLYPLSKWLVEYAYQKLFPFAPKILAAPDGRSLATCLQNGV